MSFAEILRTIVDGCSGCLGASLMGNDGIAIEEYAAESSHGSALHGDVGTAGVEFSRILDEIRKASDALGGGVMEETVIRVSRFSLIFRPIDDENFLVVAVTPDGNLGKARYLIRRHLADIRREF